MRDLLFLWCFLFGLCGGAIWFNFFDESAVGDSGLPLDDESA